MIVRSETPRFSSTWQRIAVASVALCALLVFPTLAEPDTTEMERERAEVLRELEAKEEAVARQLDELRYERERIALERKREAEQLSREEELVLEEMTLQQQRDLELELHERKLRERERERAAGYTRELRVAELKEQIAAVSRELRDDHPAMAKLRRELEMLEREYHLVRTARPGGTDRVLELLKRYYSSADEERQSLVQDHLRAIESVLEEVAEEQQPGQLR